MSITLYPNQAAAEMERLLRERSTLEGFHVEADRLLCRILRDLGFGEAVAVFEQALGRSR